MAQAKTPEEPARQQPLTQWIEAVRAYTPAEWERLPDIELYMDQVLTLMDKQLSLMSEDGNRLLTSSMINNYVKGGVVPRPNQKKYGREHLAQLYMVCMLKSVLPLPQIDEMLKGLTAAFPEEELYPAFSQAQVASLQETVERIEKTADTDAERYQLAMELALEANARRIAAVRILGSLKQEEQEKKK